MRKFLLKIAALAIILVPALATVPAMAAECGGVTTNLIECDPDNSEGQAIVAILMLVLNIFSGLVLVLAVAGIIIAGVQYLTARDNDAQVAKARMRLFQIILGLVAYALMWAFLNWLVPGGVFH